MCRIVTVGISGYRGDPTAPFVEAGFTTRPASNPSSTAMPASAVRIEVTNGMCSCDFYGGDEPYWVFDPEAARRRYERKGWSKAKIERAIEARDKHVSDTRRSRSRGTQFAAAIETLVNAGARVNLLAHEFEGGFDEPFDVIGTTQLPLGHYVARGNYFPEDTLVSLVP